VQRDNGNLETWGSSGSKRQTRRLQNRHKRPVRVTCNLISRLLDYLHQEFIHLVVGFTVIVHSCLEVVQPLQDRIVGRTCLVQIGGKVW